MVKISMYYEIKKFQRMGYGKNRIVSELGIDKKTVRKYCAMDENTYRQYIRESQYREKEFDVLFSDILNLYSENDYIRLPVSAVYDYLEETTGKLPANENSLRNYIRYLEETGQLVIFERKRYYTKVPEMPYGKQLQIDFGVQKNSWGGKYYIFAAVLSASRFKYAALQERPFRARDLIDHLLDCFDYIQGMPDELVIDQDSIMVVDENAGDIIYTKDFGDFIEEMGLKMRVCRKADPESKGKIENVIKYIKHNFFAIRKFGNIMEACESLKKWLERRANGKISQTTKKIPLIEIEEERKYLRPLKNSIYRKDHSGARETRTVSDKSRITVAASWYELPGRYRNKTVEVYKTESMLFIFDRYSGEEIANHPLSLVPGKVIKNKPTSREMGVKAQELRYEILGYFTLDSWKAFFEVNFTTFKRYVRDQCLEARKYFLNQKVDLEILDKALRYCLDNKTYSVANLNDSYQYFLEERKIEIEETPGMQIITIQNGVVRIASGINVSKPDTEPYQSLIDVFGGEQ